MTGQQDFGRVIKALKDMKWLYPDALEAAELLQQHREIRMTFVLAPADEPGQWWIGPEGAERRRKPLRDLRGVAPMWLAIRYPGSDTTRAADFVEPSAKNAGDACRNAIKRAADWIGALPDCALLAKAIEEGISVTGGIVLYDPDQVTLPVQIIPRIQRK